MNNEDLLKSIEQVIDRKLDEKLKPISDKIESLYEILDEDVDRIEDEVIENYKSINRLRTTLKRKGVI